MHQTIAGVKVASSPERKSVKLDGTSHSYDPRVRAIRADLADVALADLYFAPHYAAPVARNCTAASAMLRGAPDAAASAVSELLHGEAFHMLDARSGWAWGYCGHDHYVGYVPLDALGEPVAPTHVTRGVTPVFAAADIKTPVQQMLPAGARVSGTAEGDFLAVDDGFVHQRHVRAIDDTEHDWVAVAERYLGAPYVWGGRGLGVDCSGLVQMALAACGIAAPRDTDQQTEAIGEALGDNAALRRGDIIFFPGHVGLMVDGERLIHANAHAMAVTIEPLDDVVARLRDTHEQPVTGRRRITT
ncbi:MAG: C40 family peptidase [Alphaproteobacteria bacterium]|nr:C40 family peptidase [Alphaproteobacteria bacterium]MBU0794070.1 C40 family peptidase [Alphaproteobacteria bacterium]MBU0875615.1 C40 family peptidase [Alphaproteobacteria bacterium]MBU1769072.1 C40 family peptidase [Alphaproteobacteria bacterium]